MKNVKKLSAVIITLLLIAALSITSLAADTQIVIGGEAITNGYYQADASGALTKLDTAPDDNYFEYLDGTVTVYGDVYIKSDASDVLNIQAGTLTLTGAAGSSFTVESVCESGNSVVNLGDGVKLLLDGSVDFNLRNSGTLLYGINGFLDDETYAKTSYFETTSTYSGNIDFNVCASSVLMHSLNYSENIYAENIKIENYGTGLVIDTAVKINAKGDVDIRSAGGSPAVTAELTVNAGGDFNLYAKNGMGTTSTLTLKAKSVMMKTADIAISGVADITVDGGDVTIASEMNMACGSNLKIKGANDVNLSANTYSPTVSYELDIEAIGHVNLQNTNGNICSILTIRSSKSVDIATNKNGTPIMTATIDTEGDINFTNNNGAFVSQLEIKNAQNVTLSGNGSTPLVSSYAKINLTGNLDVKAECSSFAFAGGVEVNGAKDITVKGKGTYGLFNGGVIFNASGNVLLENEAAGNIAVCKVEINGAKDVTINCNSTTQAVTDRLSIDATGDVFIENKSAYVSGGLTVRNANNVTALGNASSPLSTGAIDISANGDILLKNSGTGMISASGMILSGANIEVKANASSPLCVGTGTIVATGDVDIENTGYASLFTSTANVKGVNVSLIGATSSAPLIQSGFNIEATGDVEVINNGSAYIVTGSMATVKGAENVKLVGNTTGYSPLITCSLNIENCENVYVENKGDAVVINSNLTISGEKVESVAIVGNRDIIEDPEDPDLTDAIIVGSISITNVKPSAEVTIKNKSGQAAFVKNESNSITAPYGVLTLNGVSYPESVASVTELPEEKTVYTGKENVLTYTVALSEGGAEEVTYAWVVEGDDTLTSDTDTLDISTLSDGEYKIYCKATVGEQTLVSAVSVITVKTCMHENAQTVGFVAETCATDGYSGDLYCEECDTILEKGEILGATNDHKGGEATCIAQAICEVCRQPYGELNADNHKGETEKRNQAEATYDAVGYTGDTYCLDCGEIICGGEEIPQLEKPVDPDEPSDETEPMFMKYIRMLIELIKTIFEFIKSVE